MDTTATRYRFSRTVPGTAHSTLFDGTAYDVHRGDEYLGIVGRDGRAWMIVTTVRGDLPGEPARYVTRTATADALSALLHGAAKLDALPTDDTVEVVESPADAAIESAAERGEQAQCTACRYYSGHTYWCPNRTPGAPDFMPAADLKPGDVVLHADGTRWFGVFDVEANRSNDVRVWTTLADQDAGIPDRLDLPVTPLLPVLRPRRPLPA
jgi:hypothetical protein